MNKRVFVPVSIVAFSMMALLVSNSWAQSGTGVPSAAPAMQGAASQNTELSGEFSSGRHHGPSLEAIEKKLGITDEQKKQIRALYVGFKDRTRKSRMELMALRDEKKTMMLSGKIDQAKLAQIDDQIVKLVSEVLRERLKLRRDRLALLTPEQIERIAAWTAEKDFRAKMKGMGWRHRHGEEH